MAPLEVPEVFIKLHPFIEGITENNQLSSTMVQVNCHTLTPQQAIGFTGRNDFPLQKGKEKLVQAVVDGYTGQAFTDMPGTYQGTLKEILTLPPVNNHNRALIIATLNAVYKKLGKADHTIHCRDNGPKDCSHQLVNYISQNYHQPRIAFFGLQPAMVEQLVGKFDLRVFDLDDENIGQNKLGVTIEDGDCQLKDIANWCDIILVTGSTIVNGTIDSFLKVDKPVIFFGNTIAAVAAILGLKRFCPISS